MVAVLGLVTAGTWIYWSLFRPSANPAIEIVVSEGSAAVLVLQQLHERGVLPSPLAGRLYLAMQPDSRNFRFGHYRIPPSSRPVDVLERILDGRVETVTVTVVEGSAASAIARLCVDAGLGRLGDWLAVLGSGDWLHDLAEEATSLEGFLFPDTYRFAVELDAESTARHMVSRFREVWREESIAAAAPWGTPYETVVLASMIEAETAEADERARVAGVFVNRLRLGMLLQCDPTVVFALQRRGEWQGRLLRRHWLVDDPYNTYRYPGLPPGPINSPGRAALAAALDPESHRYLYFVARPGGGHTFSRTLAEHNRAVEQLRRSRR